MTSHSTALQSDFVGARAPSSDSKSGFFEHHGFWAPGVRLFRALRFRAKAGLISLAFILPTLFVSMQYFNDRADSIAFSASERVGVSYLKEALPVLQAMQRQRRLAVLESVVGTAPPDLAEARAQIESAMKTLAVVETAHGAALGTQQAYAALLDRARALPAAGAGMGKVFDGHSEAIAKVMALISAATDGSNLTLDPDLDTYYLMDASMVALPATIESVSRLRGLALAVAAGAPATAAVLKDMHAQVTVGDLMDTRLEAAQGKLRSLHPEAMGAAGVDQAQAAMRKFHEVAGSGASADQINAAGTLALDALFSVQRKLADKLDGLLVARVSQLQASRNLTAGVLLAGLALAAYLFVSFQKVLEGGLREVARHIDAMRDGDLTTAPRSWGSDEVAKLMNTLHQMQASLRRIVSQVRGASDSIVTASTQIAGGAMDLASRTEQSAANLQQTASTMEEVAATVKHNEAKVDAATRLADTNAQAAVRGGQIIGQVEHTMQGINQSSSKIGEIIGTIDGIAFQTNILALNAAVEAARAGEQGRGFAVVASEVRALAQRSSAAAREIKSLIQASVEQAEAGSRVVREAGGTIQEIVASAQRVSTLLAEVSVGAREQSLGVDQSCKSVQDIDAVTQQNAALVEETAAAAGSLNDQAVGLAREVAQFRLPAG